MSRKSKAEYIGEKRRAYACASAAKRRQILDEVCETLCYTRKYVIKLMTGNIRYRERKGRGRTYSDHALANARRVWEAVGCPCTTYFVAELPRIVREYEECIALIKPREDVAAMLAMSASTLDRAFKGLPRVKPFAVKANRRSGDTAPAGLRRTLRHRRRIAVSDAKRRKPHPETHFSLYLLECGAFPRSKNG